MTENVENLMLEHLKKFKPSKRRHANVIRKSSRVFRTSKAVWHESPAMNRPTMRKWSKIVRHSIDKLRERLERIERRLEING